MLWPLIFALVIVIFAWRPLFGTTQYYFYYKEAGRGYQPGRVEVADNVTVFEEKRQAGELKVYTSKFVNPSLEWVALNVEHHKYEFIIPEGSLKKNFVLQ